jgi:hypothetical protein
MASTKSTNMARPKPDPSSASSTPSPKPFSKWADYWLKNVLRAILPTHIRDTDHLINDLRRTFPNGLLPGARLFSVDAIGMYSNIDTDHGIDVLTQWLRNYYGNLLTCMPVDFVIEALAKIMISNIFQFGDTYWKQTRGCAMGTSTAFNYAYLYISLLEVQCLLPCYETCLPSFKWFINDGIGVWLPPSSNDQLTWDVFLRCLNQWGTLCWTCDGHVDSLIFLDLRILIGPDRQYLIFHIYQKPMNLHLFYIPPARLILEKCSAASFSVVYALIGYRTLTFVTSMPWQCSSLIA